MPGPVKGIRYECASVSLVCLRVCLPPSLPLSLSLSLTSSLPPTHSFSLSMQVKALYLDPMQLREVHSSLLILSLTPRYKSRFLALSRSLALVLSFSLSLSRARALILFLLRSRALSVSRVCSVIYTYILLHHPTPHAQTPLHNVHLCVPKPWTQRLHVLVLEVRRKDAGQ
jgi:hypothetical protein